ncbi:MAG: hypothetical protein ACE5HQ_04455 [Gemmatimonadota bacterium]
MFRVAAIYAIVAWVVVQVATTTLPVLLLPGWLTRAIVAAAVLGFPVAVVLAWAFDLTSEGLRRTHAAEEADASAGTVRETAWIRGAVAMTVTLITAGLGWVAWNVWLGPGPIVLESRPSSPGSSVPLDPTHVAVLYFDDFSPGQDLGYLADGLTEALIHELARVTSLQVISRNGVKPYRDPRIPVDSLARVLGAGSLVEGSVERSGDTLSARIQLIDGTSGLELLSRRLRRNGKNLLRLRDDMVAEAGRLLSQRLGHRLDLAQTRAGTRSSQAWTRFQQAADLIEDADTLRWSLGDAAAARRTLVRADSLLAEAESLDGRWVDPVVQRGWTAAKLARIGAPSRPRYDESALRRGLAYAERALEMRPGDPTALELRGSLRSDLSWLTAVAADSAQVVRLREQAERDLRACVDADPSRARAWVALADLLRSGGDFPEASVAARHALDADPFLIHAEKEILFSLAQVWLDLGDLERASRWNDEGRQRYPVEPAFTAAKLVILAGRDGAGASVDTAWSLVDALGGWNSGRFLVAAALARAGLRDSARSVISATRAEASGDPWEAYYEAKPRIELGERQQALDLLGRFLDALPNRKEYIARDWWWKPLHGNPQFQRLVSAGD